MNPRPIPISNREGYDLWSADYDRYPNPTVAIDDRFFPAQWGHLTGRRVLEVGCGTGRHTVRLAAQGNHVTGIDPSPGMLAVAREKLKGFTDVHLIESRFPAADDLEAHCFAALVAALVLEHIRDLPMFFSAARRALGPAGELHVSEIHPVRAAQGILAHFKTPAGDEFALESVPHPDGAIERAAEAGGFQLLGIQDAFGDKPLAAMNPKWIRHLDMPMIRMWSWVVAPPAGPPAGSVPAR
jgi:malonyl-CoA O-methyltransferase